MHSICRGFWFFQGHTWTHAPAQAHTMHTHTHSENALAQFRGEARPVSSPGLTVEGGEWELIEFAQLQPMGLQTILQDSHSPPHTHTWKAASYYTLNLIRAYVYGSEHMWPPLFPRPPPLHLPLCHSICLSMYRSVFLTVCFFCFLSDCLSALRHFTFFTVRIDPPLRDDKGCGFQKAKAKPINS